MLVGHVVANETALRFIERLVCSLGVPHSGKAASLPRSLRNDLGTCPYEYMNPHGVVHLSSSSLRSVVLGIHRVGSWVGAHTQKGVAEKI